MLTINRRYDGQVLNAAYGCTWPVDTVCEGFIAVRIIHAGDTLIMQRTQHNTRQAAVAYLEHEDYDDVDATATPPRLVDQADQQREWDRHFLAG